VALSIQTAEPLVHCPVVVLVHAQTSGSAETFAWGLRRFGRARIVGTSTTSGAAPGPQQEVTLPGGINLFYPTARWLGPEGEVRIESNGEGLGGVEPDVRIPMNETNFRARHADGKDLSLGHAIQLLREQ
jgi:carboxyl-terminal processing protease